MTKILLIEDEALLAQAYIFLFQHEGYTVVSAGDGEEGLKKVKSAKPDLIVLDMMMPKLDGLGFLRHYNIQKHPEVKIILLSNMRSPEYEDAAFALGISRYEIKSSLSPSELIDIIKQTLLS